MSLPWPVVEVQQDDLLPRSQNHSPRPDRERARRADERAAQVGKAVAVLPSVVMVVSVVLGRQLLQRFFQVSYGPGFELNSRDARGRAGIGDTNDAFSDARIRYDLLQL